MEDTTRADINRWLCSDEPMEMIRRSKMLGPSAMHYAPDVIRAMSYGLVGIRKVRSETCVCGHVKPSHKLDESDPYVSERCHCGCAGYDDGRGAMMQGDDE